MRPALLSSALLLLCATLASTAASTPQEIFDSARAQIFDNIRHAPRYTCVENITRTRYVPEYSRKLAACHDYVDAHARAVAAGAAPGAVRWHDRLRLDVAVLNGQETFAWAGARQFESTSLEDLVSSGTTGTGDFFSFLISVFTGDADRIAHEGVKKTPFGLLTVFNYNVPLGQSHYKYHTTDFDTVLAHHGAFWLDNETWALRRLIVESSEPPAGGDMCMVRNTIDYQHARIGNGDYLIPDVSTMEVIYNDGSESKNETRFSGCHEYGVESTIRYGDPAAELAAAASAPLVPLPPATRIQVGLVSRIDTATTAAGDEVIASPLREVRDKKLGVLLKTTDRLHGRILRLEQFVTAEPRWVLAVRFDTLERNGAEQPISLSPLDDGDRTPAIQAPAATMLGRGRIVGSSPPPQVLVVPPRPKGGGVFIFSAKGELVLDRGFHSSWETH